MIPNDKNKWEKGYHEYIKDGIKDTDILVSYTRLEQARVDADYDLTRSISKNELYYARRYKDVILAALGEIPLGEGEDDESYFKRIKEQE